jgi:hypothetical protein
MRTVLTLTLALSLSMLGGCASKKKAPQNPGNSTTESAPAGDATESNEEKEMAAPDKGDESSSKSSDPCEGGE